MSREIIPRILQAPGRLSKTSRAAASDQLHPCRPVPRARKLRHHVSMVQADLSQQGKLELVLDIKGELLEGPIWDERIKKLHFVDINAQQIHTFEPDSKSQQPRYLNTEYFCCTYASHFIGYTKHMLSVNQCVYATLYARPEFCIWYTTGMQQPKYLSLWATLASLMIPTYCWQL